MKLNRILMLLGMLLILPVSVLGLTAGDTQAYYKLENSGFNYIDSTPTGADITSGSAPVQSAGIINFGQDYSGDRTWTSTTITTGGSGSINIWVNPDSQSGSDMFFDANDGSARTFMYYYGNAGAYNFRIDNVNVFGSPFGALSTGTWYMITMTWTPTAQTLYLDGVPVATDTQTLTTTDFTTTYVGCHNGGVDCWDGKLDELSIWNSTLSPGDVIDLYNGGAPTSSQQYPYSAGNTHPTITQIANQTILEDTNMTGVNFTIGDAEDPVTNLTVTATSSNTGLVPNANLFLSAVSADMTINATPLADQFGNTTINITVNDTGGLTNSTVFNLEVLNVNDPPTISNISDKVMIESSTLTIPFNVTDIDTPYTELSYQVGFTNSTLFTNYTFTNNDGTAQNLTLTADALYGFSSVNLVVSDGEYEASTIFEVSVNCNTTTRYNTTFPLAEPPACYQVDVSYDKELDILNYTWYDFGGTVDNNWIFVYRTTGGANQQISYETSTNISGEWIFNYSANYPNDNFRVLGYMSDSNRTFVGGETDINVVDFLVDQSATLNTFFSKQDGLIYSVLIMVLFLTIGVASQSATMTLILSVLALFVASKFVLNVPAELLWVTGAVILILIWFIAKLRVD